jgi:hypothetical protein
MERRDSRTDSDADPEEEELAVLRGEMHALEEALAVAQLKNAALERLVWGMQGEQDQVSRQWQRERHGPHPQLQRQSSSAGLLPRTRALLLRQHTARVTPYERTRSVPFERRPVPAQVARSQSGLSAVPVARARSGLFASQARLPGLAPQAVLDYKQPSHKQLRPAKPQLELANGGPKVGDGYREWAEPLHGGLMIDGRAGLRPSSHGRPFSSISTPLISQVRARGRPDERGVRHRRAARGALVRAVGHGGGARRRGGRHSIA